MKTKRTESNNIAISFKIPVKVIVMIVLIYSVNTFENVWLLFI